MSVQVICPQCGIVVSEDAEEIGQRRLANHIALAHSKPRYCEHCKNEDSFKGFARFVLAAAERLAEARVRYSQAFQRAKATTPGMSDGHAHQVATEVTASQVTVLEAELEIAKRRLQ